MNPFLKLQNRERQEEFKQWYTEIEKAWYSESRIVTLPNEFAKLLKVAIDTGLTHSTFAKYDEGWVDKYQKGELLRYIVNVYFVKLGLRSCFLAEDHEERDVATLCAAYGLKKMQVFELGGKDHVDDRWLVYKDYDRLYINEWHDGVQSNFRLAMNLGYIQPSHSGEHLFLDDRAGRIVVKWVIQSLTIYGEALSVDKWVSGSTALDTSIRMMHWAQISKLPVSIEVVYEQYEEKDDGSDEEEEV